ncbi:MAG: methyltransferase domain-containing protein [Thiobacillaceae bacterium]|nr:methyltransferase domain-containing protein [Thiobacillaceae bacterium]MDW8322831.1 methyltransferase domain-containing protein [Burkholderiales bacterium]
MDLDHRVLILDPPQTSSSLYAWLDSDLGRYALGRELAWYDQACADLFGFNAMQLGFCQIDFLRANRMPFRVCGGQAGGAFHCALEQLPIASESLDLLALPHALEFSPHPHQLLRECERVLRPEGKLLISGFNPLSLWGLRRWLARSHAIYPWHGRFIRLARLKDWLALLGFELTSGRMICYAPPFGRADWLDRFAWLESAGDRWWAMGGGIYLLLAVKRRVGLRLIAPKWDKSWLARPVLGPTTQRLANDD